MKRNLLTLIFILTATYCNSQHTFQLVYHPFPSQNAVCLKNAVGGGYLSGANYTDANGEKGILLTKIDEQFNIVWERTIGDIGIEEKINSFIQDSIGQIYLIGITDTNGLIIKMDSSASGIIWSKKLMHYRIYPDNILLYNSNTLFVNGMVEILSSSYNDSIFLARIDTSGNIQWIKTYISGNTYCRGIELMKNLNGELIMECLQSQTHNYGGLSSFDINGIPVWDYRWGLDGTFTIPGGIMEGMTKSKSDYALFGTKLTGGNGDVKNFIMICDSLGIQKQWMEFSIDVPAGNSILTYIKGLTGENGSYLFTGTLNRGYLTGSPAIIKVDSNLVPQWCRTFGMDSLWDTRPGGIVQTPDKGYLISGTRKNDLFFIKTDSSGFTGCNDSSYNVFSNSTNSLQISALTFQNSQVLNIGSTPSVTMLSPLNNIDTVCGLINSMSEILLPELFIFPNPVTNILSIRINEGSIQNLSILNILGEKMFTIPAVNPKHLNIDCIHLSPGIYFLQAKINEGIATAKFIKN